MIILTLALIFLPPVFLPRRKNIFEHDAYKKSDTCHGIQEFKSTLQCYTLTCLLKQYIILKNPDVPIEKGKVILENLK